MRMERQEMDSTRRTRKPGLRDRLALFTSAITALVMLGTIVISEAGASSSSVLVLNESKTVTP